MEKVELMLKKVLFILCFFSLSLGSSACQPETPFQVNIHFLKPELLKTVQFLDVVFFFADKVKCSEINAGNYNNASSDTVNDARILNKASGSAVIGIKLTPEDYKKDGQGDKIERWLSGLGDNEQLARNPNGLKTNIYVLALTATKEGKKKPIAEGCTTFLLARGKTTSFSLSLKELKEMKP